MGRQEGDQAIYFYEGGVSAGEALLWDNGQDRFEFSDDLFIAGDLSGVDYYQGNDIFLSGDLSANTISAASKSFRIDHPLDPANRLLYHTSMESPDMKNFYDGVVELDESGASWVELPSYFGALNRDFRYQLTAVGGPGPNLYVANEVTGNRFQIAGGTAGLKVSWQVTGIRQDAYAKMNRTQVEVDKPENERGTYLFPEGFAADTP